MPPISLRTRVKCPNYFPTNKTNNKKSHYTVTKYLLYKLNCNERYWINPMSSCKTGNKATLLTLSRWSKCPLKRKRLLSNYCFETAGWNSGTYYKFIWPSHPVNFKVSISPNHALKAKETTGDRLYKHCLFCFKPFKDRYGH